MKISIKKKLHSFLLTLVDYTTSKATGFKMSDLQSKIKELENQIHTLQYLNIAELELDLIHKEENLAELESELNDVKYTLGIVGKRLEESESMRENMESTLRAIVALQRNCTFFISKA